MKVDKIRVLLVDDDDLDIELTSRAILDCQTPRFEIQTASSRDQAMEMLNQHDFDVMLLDLGLPESTGVETLQYVCTNCSDTPIVVLTGYDNDEIATEALNSGAQDYLVKGRLSPELLSRSIRYAIHRHQLLQQLAQGNALLAEKNERLRDLYDTAHQFVDNVSHEFRTPLTVLREFCALMREGLSGPINEQQRQHLDVMAIRIDDLAFMVDDMLDTSRLEAGLLNVWRRRCQIDDIVDHVYSLLDRRATTKKVVLSRQIEAGLPEVYCDAEKIGRVIVNLVVNAIKFTPEGGKIDLCVSRGRKPHEVVVGITDTGVGINAEDLQAIFQRFKQIDSGWRASTKGFGLGLNIAQELVYLNLGQMEVDSEPGVGSTFVFSIPTAEPLPLFQRYLERLKTSKDCPSEIALITADIESTGPGDATPVVDEFLQETARRNDLVVRLPQRGWCLAAACPRSELSALLARFEQQWSQLTRNCPISNMPSISMGVLGSWQYATQQQELIEHFRRLIEQNQQESPCRRVLVVDDDREVVMGLELRLASEGFEVITACDGAAGIDAAVAQSPDAIVLDVRMPGVSGIDTLAELKRREETRDIPVVMLSASLRDQQLALDEGARFFVQKPYDVTTLVSAVNTSMSGACQA